MSLTCLNKIPLVVFTPQQQFVIYPWTKSSFVWAVKSSQRAQKESCPIVHQIIGIIRPYSWLWILQWSCKLAPAHLGHGPRTPREHYLRQSPVKERSFAESQVSSRQFQHAIGETKIWVMSKSLRPHGLYSPRNSPGQNTRVDSLSLLGKPKNTGQGSLSLLQWIFPTQESNWGLLHCRHILYQLSYQGSPFHWRNKNMRLGALERVRGTIWLYPSPRFPGTDECQERTSQLVISPSGKKESMRMSSWLTQLCEKCPSCPVLSHPIQSNPIQNTELWAMCWGRGKKRFAEIGFSEGINGMWILLTASQIPSRSLPINCWVHFILRSLRWHTGTMNLPCASPFAAFFGQLSVHSPGGSESKLWQRGSEHTQKTHPNLLRKDHKIEL